MSVQFNNRINRQIPDNIKKKYPNFVKFLTAYYTWMEQPDNPYYHLRNHLSYLDFEKTLDSYVEQLKNDYLFSVPQEILGNKELFIKYSKQFNISIGTEESFNFLFNILYNEDIDLYYPKDDILRASDGEWVQSETKLYTTHIDNPSSFKNKKIEQKDNDNNVIASAVIEEIKTRFSKQYKISEVQVSTISGEFTSDYPLIINGGEKQIYVMPTGLSYNVENGGQNYRQGDVLEIPDSEVYEVNDTASESSVYNTQITSSFTSNDITFELNGNVVSSSDFNFDGQTINYNSINEGDNINIVFPLFKGFIIVEDVDNNGAVETIRIIETPIGVNDSILLETSDGGGSGAEIYIEPSFVFETGGFYRDRNGWLSSNKVLQDSDFYQEFSYVIKTGQDIDTYRDIVMDVLHPAGMKMFGQINILSLIDAMIRDHTLDVEKFVGADVIRSEKVDLGTTYSFFDKFKFFIDPELATSDDYKDLKLELFQFNNNKQRFKTADLKIQKAPCIDNYFEDDYYDFGYVCEGALDGDTCVDNYSDDGYYSFGYICDE